MRLPRIHILYGAGWFPRILIWIPVLVALLATGCASTTAQTRLPNVYQIPLYVENNVSDRLTIYVTSNGRITRRVGDCVGLRRCTFLLDKRTSENAIRQGLLELGYRHFGERNRGPTHFLSTPAWEGMQATLVVNYVDNFIVPDTRQAN